jgi:hypothetical protein
MQCQTQRLPLDISQSLNSSKELAQIHMDLNEVDLLRHPTIIKSVIQLDDSKRSWKIQKRCNKNAKADRLGEVKLYVRLNKANLRSLCTLDDSPTSTWYATYRKASGTSL